MSIHFSNEFTIHITTSDFAQYGQISANIGSKAETVESSWYSFTNHVTMDMKTLLYYIPMSM